MINLLFQDWILFVIAKQLKSNLKKTDDDQHCTYRHLLNNLHLYLQPFHVCFELILPTLDMGHVLFGQITCMFILLEPYDIDGIK